MLSPYLLQPVADLAEALGLARLDPPVGHGVGVQGQVAVAAGAGHQHVDALLERLDLVVGLPRPLRPSVMQVSQGRSSLERPSCCSGVSKSPGSPQRLLMISCGWSVREPS